MRKGLFASIAVLACLALVFGSTCEAGPISLSGASLEYLVGENPTALMITDMSGPSLKAEIISAAYPGDDDNYVYLYQIENTGQAGNSAAEMFTLRPFLEADDSSQMGWLTGAIPSDFLTGGANPDEIGDNQAFVEQTPIGPVVSFYFTKRVGDQIKPEQHSRVLYITSRLTPGIINGNVIGGTVGAGPVVGPTTIPIPEPRTIAYLATSSLIALGVLMVMARLRSSIRPA